MRSTNAMVRAALAHHPARDPSLILPRHHLEHDLGMTPLELVWIVVKVEEVEGVELPVEDLSSLTTVGELIAFLAHAIQPSRSPPPRGGGVGRGHGSPTA